MRSRVVCFGEVMLRLSPPGAETLLQSPQLIARFGGAELNVAVSLARFGHAARMVTVLPDNTLGAAALAEMRRHGVDVGAVRPAPGRLGLYFLTPPAGARSGAVLYDRADSSFARLDPAAIDWDAALTDADWLHLSGVTPAVSPGAAEAALGAVRAARAKGLTVSYDGNYRPSMWAAQGRDGAQLLGEMIACADLLFGDERDVGLVLGRSFAAGDPLARRNAAAEAAFAAFPQLLQIASTVRTVHAGDRHDLAGFFADRSGAVTAPALTLSGVVDRVGGGDAFAAGLIHGLRSGMAPRPALDFALAAAALKHAIPGDFNLVDVSEVEALLAGGGDVRR